MVAPAIRGALGRLGFTAEASIFITDVQGMDDLGEFTLLTNEEVEGLCKVVRRPGGTIPNPQVGAGLPATIPNPGLQVSLRAENNLKMACYYLRFKEKTSRAVTPAQITLPNVRALKDHREWEKTHDDVEAPEINLRDWPRIIESIEEWLRGCSGVTGIPLAYVIRDTIDVPAADPVGGYGSKLDELIARAPIQDAAGAMVATYLSDRAKVWEKISELTRENECWSYVRPAQRTRDGRLAFVGLKDHYLGANNVDNMSSIAEKKLQTIKYSGEKRRWNFEKFVRLHIDQHSILEGLVEHGYSGIDARSKVRYLLAGIGTNRLDTVKTRIMSDAALRNDFHACVNLFQDFIKQGGGGEVTDITIAGVTSSGKKRNRDDDDDQWKDVVPDMSIADRYYDHPEYSTLTPEQKYGLKIKRKKRNGSGKNSGSGKRRGGRDRSRGRSGRGAGKKGDLNLSSRSIKALATAMKAAKEADDGTEATEPLTDDSEDESVKSSKKSNRSNSALRRRRR